MTLTELQDVLGERMRALCKPGISQKKVRQEIERSKGVTMLASQMIRNANTIVSAKKAVGDFDKASVSALVGHL